MRIIVDNEEEAVVIARRLVSICKDIKNSNIDDCESVGHRFFLSHLKDLIEVQAKKE